MTSQVVQPKEGHPGRGRGVLLKGLSSTKALKNELSDRKGVVKNCCVEVLYSSITVQAEFPSALVSKGTAQGRRGAEIEYNHRRLAYKGFGNIRSTGSCSPFSLPGTPR